MKTRGTVILTGALLVLAATEVRSRGDDPEPPAGAKAELAKLKGTWTVTKAVWGKREAKAPPGMTYAFDGDKLTRTTPLGKGAGKQTFKVKIDTKKKPYKITMTPEDKDKGQSGIFKVEKGELFLATGRGKGGKAPADFKGDDVMVLVMKKEEKAKE
jgi:uncharacterized protein (TIGR03067 family)